MKISPRVMYIFNNSAPIDGLKTKLLQKEPLMFQKTLGKQLSFEWDSQNQNNQKKITKVSNV